MFSHLVSIRQATFKKLPLNNTKMTENNLTIPNTTKTSDGKTARSWFNSGERLVYDLTTKQIANTHAAMQPNQLCVFNKHTIYPEQNAENLITFLPGFPDGSFGG